MKIFSFSIDKNILEPNSIVAKRMIWFDNFVDKYCIIVPSIKKIRVSLSYKIEVFASGGRSKISQLFKIYKLANRLLKQENYDIITSQDNYYIGFLALILAKKFDIGLEIQVHGWEKYGGLRKIISNFILKRANIVRTVSKRSKDKLVKEIGLEAEKIAVIPIFVDTSDSYGFERDYREKEKIIFLTVSRLTSVKNIGMQIEAIKKLVENKLQVELWIVGKGEEENNLKKKIGELKLENYVKLLGYKNKPELNEIYKQADCFLLTSQSEGWGMVIIEAAGFGLPIIMTDVGCAGEVIKNEISGLVIPVNDKEVLRQAMRRLVEDVELRKGLGVTAREEVEKLADRKETLELYLDNWRM
ncbi:MAG: glycosyltransferase [Candidatus Magasanikbacteria bacterium]|nr:glycosyltransferase [Candidatus Magasanikbacteria bacterium]